MYKQGFYGEKIVWITYNALLKSSSKANCNQSVIDVVSEGMFSLDVQFLRSDQHKTISGLVSFVGLAWFICLFAR